MRASPDPHSWRRGAPWVGTSAGRSARTGGWLASGGYDKVIIVLESPLFQDVRNLSARKPKGRNCNSATAPWEKESHQCAWRSTPMERGPGVNATFSGAIRVWKPSDSKRLLFRHQSSSHSTTYGEFPRVQARDGKLLIIPVGKASERNNGNGDSEFFYDADYRKKSAHYPPRSGMSLSALVATKRWPSDRGRPQVGADDDDDPSGSVQIFGWGTPAAFQKNLFRFVASVDQRGRKVD